MRKLIIEDETGRSGYDLVKEVTTVGRDASCDLALEAVGVSRQHLRITQVGENLLAEDLGSSNGTELNGETLEVVETLGRGDVLKLGDIILHVDEAIDTAAGGPRGDSSRENRQRVDARKKKSNVPFAIGIALLLAIFAWMFRPDSLRSQAGDNQGSKTGTKNALLDNERDTGEAAMRDEGEELANRRLPLNPEERRKTQRRIQLLKAVKLEVEGHLVQDNFIAAQSAITAFELRENGIATTLRKLLKKKMSRSAKKTREEFAEQRRAGRTEYARGFLVEKISQFPAGSEARNDLEAFLKGRDVVARGDTEARRTDEESVSNSNRSNDLRDRTNTAGGVPNKVSPGTPDEAKADFGRLRPQAAAAFRNRDYAGATIIYESMVHLVARAEVSAHEAVVVKRRLRLSKHLRRMQNTISTLVAADARSFTGIPVTGGKRVDCAGYREGKFAFYNGENELIKDWSELSDEAILSLITKSKPEGADAIDAGVFAILTGKKSRGHAMIRRGEKNMASLKPKAQLALADAMGIEKPRQGFVWIGKEYLTARNVARVDAQATIDKNVPLLAHSDPKVRREAYIVLRSMGPRAASSFHRGLLEAKASLLKKLEVQPVFQKLAKLAAMREELETLRHHALELIFDEQAYPYPYRGVGGDAASRHATANREIKIRVKPIRELWASKAKASVGADFLKSVQLLAEYNLELDDIGIGRGAADPVFLSFLPAKGEVSIQTFANSKKERLRIDTSFLWIADNDKKKSIAKGIERQQVAITNQYRMLMGRHAVQLNDRLVECARMHSHDMSVQGFFAHENPTVKEKKTPFDRMRWVGFFGSGGSENIHAGGSDPRSAHEGWITSSGHHRNILGRSWLLLGSGQDGRNWTQNFSRTEYSDEERERRGLPKGGLRTLQQKN
ncbi:MAG: FHA domain-containing protein [Planctomycetota bacterium]